MTSTNESTTAPTLVELRAQVELAERETSIRRRAVRRYRRIRRTISVLLGVAIGLVLGGVALTFLNAIILPTNLLRPVIIACYVVGGIGTGATGLALGYYVDECCELDRSTYSSPLRVTPEDRLAEAQSRLDRLYDQLSEAIVADADAHRTS